MDINDQLQPIVASLLDSLKVSMEDEIRNQINAEVIDQVARTEIAPIVRDITVQQLTDRVSKFNFEATSQEQLTILIRQITDQINNTLLPQAGQQITAEITKRLAQINVPALVSGIIENKLNGLVSAGDFPTAGIPHTAINFKGFRLTGDTISGGIITNFGSTGIDDRSTQVQMTVLDQGVAFENTVFAPNAKIKGTLTVDGDLIISGGLAEGPALDQLVSLTSERVKLDLNEDLFQGFTGIVEKNLREGAFDLNKITQNGKEVVNGNRLGYHIVDTNIQRVGVLNDLQTSGENLLSDTLYVTTRRVGVNTIDPGATFVVWDEEVEMVMTKRGQDLGYMGTPRYQRLSVGANNQDNLILNTDGSVEIENLRVGNVPMSSATAIPNYSAITGTIVWNESPSPGGPVGWVCLGATRWAKFGIIE